jgi:hypothetical protein
LPAAVGSGTAVPAGDAGIATLLLATLALLLLLFPFPSIGDREFHAGDPGEGNDTAEDGVQEAAARWVSEECARECIKAIGVHCWVIASVVRMMGAARHKAERHTGIVAPSAVTHASRAKRWS